MCGVHIYVYEYFESMEMVLPADPPARRLFDSILQQYNCYKMKRYLICVLYIDDKLERQTTHPPTQADMEQRVITPTTAVHPREMEIKRKVVQWEREREKEYLYTDYVYDYDDDDAYFKYIYKMKAIPFLFCQMIRLNF